MASNVKVKLWILNIKFRKLNLCTEISLAFPFSVSLKSTFQFQMSFYLPSLQETIFSAFVYIKIFCVHFILNPEDDQFLKISVERCLVKYLMHLNLVKTFGLFKIQYQTAFLLNKNFFLFFSFLNYYYFLEESDLRITK